MKIKATVLLAAICIGGSLAAGLTARDGAPSTQPAATVEKPVDPIGAAMAHLLQTENPAVGSRVEITVEPPVGELHGTLTSINDRWAVVDTTTENLGVWWIPISKIQVIRVDSKIHP